MINNAESFFIVTGCMNRYEDKEFREIVEFIMIPFVTQPFTFQSFKKTSDVSRYDLCK